MYPLSYECTSETGTSRAQPRLSLVKRFDSNQGFQTSVYIPVFVQMEEEFLQYYDTDVVLSNSSDVLDSSDYERESFDGWLVDGE